MIFHQRRKKDIAIANKIYDKSIHSQYIYICSSTLPIIIRQGFNILQIDRPTKPKIPGISSLVDKDIPNGLLLLCGPIGSGKSVYCRQFFLDGIDAGDYCIYLSSNMTENQYQNMFSTVQESTLSETTKFINPLRYPLGGFDDKLNQALSNLVDTIDALKKSNNNKNEAKGKGEFKSVRLVVDSLTHLFVLFGEAAIIRFVTQLSLVLHDAEAMAIFALTTDGAETSSSPSSTSPSSSKNILNILSSVFDGTIEMKLSEGDHSNEAPKRSIRLLSIRGLHHDPSWISFEIQEDGSIVFPDHSPSSSYVCALCGKLIAGTPLFDSEFTFDTQNCLETYRKLAGVYGSNISEIGLPSEVVNVNFFFIDIVGLSDPSLSVKKQIAKIENLNRILTSCDALVKSTKDKKIVLPTGDGMAIGFLLHPELPLRLSIELHKKLRSYNYGKKSKEDSIGVRIGISSGPVFIVSDINGNQNVWGPGIIIARRVMDLGDNMHILLADPLASQLIALKDEYRMVVNPISNYEIKHGQTITLYSAYSNEFGNSTMPAKITYSISKSNTNTAA
jgi:KaiC/GvpD/RAD55 family RecA-like ATPase/class 3 adenylate cyclase